MRCSLRRHSGRISNGSCTASRWSACGPGCGGCWVRTPGGSGSGSSSRRLPGEPRRAASGSPAGAARWSAEPCPRASSPHAIGDPVFQGASQGGPAVDGGCAGRHASAGAASACYFNLSLRPARRSAGAPWSRWHDAGWLRGPRTPGACWLVSCDDRAMGPAEGSGALAGRVARPGAGGVVSRPGLFDQLAASARVTVLSAPPGSGKTVLLRSWIGEAGLEDNAAWVPVGPGERDPQRFWLSVLGALRRTSAGSALVRAVTAAPDLDGWAIVERLLKDLAPLADRVWLVLDDVHELGSDQARRQLELLVMRGPPELRVVLAARHDLRLGLHRLRLEGELTELRAADLRFTVAEARELLAAAGVDLPGPALEMLYEQTEGWAAGLRLAALSLAGHEDPERFAAEFSGSERTVAEYLVAEVLERQSERVRRLLLVTSVLDRVNGELADLLPGGSGGERVLQELEEANAFVVSLDAARSWFRYHR